MDEYDWHIGEKSIWDGSLKTECGKRIPGPHTSTTWLLFWKPKNPCPVCLAIKKNSK